nr:hypothetical protein [Tanacetum cinerariifolium]
MVLELADRTISKPTDVAENVFVNFQSLNKIDLIDAGESDFDSEEIENFLNDDSIPIGIENYVFDIEEDILFLEKLLNEDPPLMNSYKTNSSIKEPEHSFSMGCEHFSTSLVTKLDEVAESSTKNLVPIPREYEVTSDNENESNEPIKDDSLAFTTFPNPLFNDKDDVTIHEDDVPIEESKDNESQREEIDIVTNTDELLPPGFENDDSEGEIDSENELSDNESSESDFDNPSFPRPPPKPPDSKLAVGKKFSCDER